MSGILLFTDPHFGANGNSQLIRDSQTKFFDEVFFPYIKSNDIRQVICCGDFFDTRTSVDVNTLNYGKKFLERFRDINCNLTIVLGNHDIYFKDHRKVNSLNPIAKNMPNIEIIWEKPVVRVFNSKLWLLMPWVTQEDKAGIAEYLERTDIDYCAGHFDIIGFEMTKGHTAEKGMSVKDFSKFKQVYSGHYHKPQTQGNITYIGSLYQMNWGDSGQTHGFWHINGDSKFITNDVSSRFVKIRDSEIKNIKTNDIVRVYMDNTDTEKDIKTRVDQISKITPNVEVIMVPTISGDDAETIEHSADKNITQLIDEYVDTISLPADLKSSRLKNITKMIYQDACVKLGGVTEDIHSDTGRLVFEEITLKNFKAFGNKVSKVSFKSGTVTRIVGINGAGKSTIIDAIFTCLYGKSMHGVNLTELVNDTNRKECLLTVTFSKGGKSYRIERGIAPARLDIFIDGVKKDAAAKKSDDQEFIEELIGMRRHTFRNVIVLSEDLSQYFMELEASEQRSIVEELLNVRIFTIMQTVLKEYSSEINSIKASEKLNIVKAQERLNSETLSYTQRKSMAEQLHNKRNESIREAKEKLLTLEVEKEMLESVTGDKASLELEFDDINIHVENLKLKKQRIEQSVLDYGKAQAAKETAIALQSMAHNRAASEEQVINGSIDKKRQEIETLKTKIDEYEKIIYGLGDPAFSVHRMEEECSSLQSSIADTKIRIKETQNISDLIDAGKCPTCGREDFETEEYETVEKLPEFKTRLAALEKELVTYKNSLSSYEKDVQTLVFTEKLLKEAKTNLGIRKEELDILLRKVSIAMEVSSAELIKLEEANSIELPEYPNVDTVEISRKITDGIVKLSEINSQINAIDQASYKLELVNSQLLQYKQQLDKSTKEIPPPIPQVTELDIFKNDITDAQKNVDKAEMQEKYLVIIKKDILSDSGIKSHIVTAYLPYLNSRINYYLDLFDLPIRFDFDGSLEPKITARYNEECSFMRFSAGQRNRINLAIAMAFSDLARRKSTIHSNALFMDEVLDAHLDEAGANAVLDIIKQKAVSEGMCVFLASHRPRGMEGFDAELLIERTGGFSNIC